MDVTHPKDNGNGSCDNGRPLSRFQFRTASPCIERMSSHPAAWMLRAGEGMLSSRVVRCKII